MSQDRRAEGPEGYRSAEPPRGRRLRRSPRRWLTLLGVTLLVTVATATTATPASAVSGGGCSGYVNSTFYWDQNACIGWTGSQIQGQSTTRFLTKFNRLNVTSCDWQGTIVSSYGTATTYHLDCYYLARAGGTWTWTQLLGPGRSVGDRYRWHTCMVVWTLAKYDSCAGAHPVSPLLTR